MCHSSTSTTHAPFLFSVDLEDVRSMIPGGQQYVERVPVNTSRYLELLSRNGMRCTFFTVGDVARRYPGLIGEIAGAGHEIACHSSEHRPLPRHNPASFRDDLRRNIDDLYAAGASEICGFRAPVLSLTAGQSWAYEILHEQGISYSSSVLPTWNPLYGWPGFPRDPSWQQPGVWELPVSITGWPLLGVPFASGVYFRVLPFPMVRRLCRNQLAAGKPLVTYCHPYDIDTDQDHFMHPELDGSRVKNWLMYLRRSSVIPRLQRLVTDFGPIVPYGEFVAALQPPSSSASGATCHC